MEGCGPGVGLWGGISSPVLDMLPWKAYQAPKWRCWTAAGCESGAQKSALGWRHQFGRHSTDMGFKVGRMEETAKGFSVD